MPPLQPCNRCNRSWWTSNPSTYNPRPGFIGPLAFLRKLKNFKKSLALTEYKNKGEGWWMLNMAQHFVHFCDVRQAHPVHTVRWHESGASGAAAGQRLEPRVEGHCIA